MFRACGERTADLLSRSWGCSCVYSSAGPVVSNAASPSSSCTAEVASCSRWAAGQSQVNPHANSCSDEVVLAECHGGTSDEAHPTAQAMACAHRHSCGTTSTGSACLMVAEQGSSLAA